MAPKPFRPIPPKVLVAVAAVLLLEFASFILLIVRLGFWATVGLTVLTALIGMALAKRHARVLFRGGDQGPGRDLLDSVLGLIGGVLMISPGFLLDTLGLLLLLGPVRRLAKLLIGGWIGTKVATMAQTAATFRSPRQTRDGSEAELTDGQDEPSAERSPTGVFGAETPFDRIRRRTS